MNKKESMENLEALMYARDNNDLLFDEFRSLVDRRKEVMNELLKKYQEHKNQK
jgi:hypothetical protein